MDETRRPEKERDPSISNRHPSVVPTEGCRFEMDETRRPEKERDPSAAEALAAWRELLGPGHVVEDGPRLELAERATFATAQRFLAVVEPKDRDEVAACLRVAVRYGVPLYPVSRGLNRSE